MLHMYKMPKEPPPSYELAYALGILGIILFAVAIIALLCGCGW